MSVPFEPFLFGYEINLHLILEYLAFFLGYRYYVFLRKRTTDLIEPTNRLSIILGAAIGAFLGSRIFGYLENPVFPSDIYAFLQLFNTKTIMGGLFGGLLGVELAKKIIGEKIFWGPVYFSDNSWNFYRSNWMFFIRNK